MGSGSSKEKQVSKQPQARKGDNVSKATIQNKVDNNSSGKDNKNVGYNSNTQKAKTNNSQVGGYHSNSKQTGYNNSSKNNQSFKSGGNNKVDPFESDSDEEEEDINAVLEATKNEYNRNLRERDQQTSNIMYPETYAQRLQRQQYKNEPTGLIRQKTIYRNPDEWEIDENEVDNFDVSKFKQANFQKTGGYTEQNAQVNSEIYSPSGPESNTQFNRHENYEMDRLEMERKKSLPRYDISEEALLDEIEKEYVT
ncbi:hypothetical protein ACF0H5_022450 [Mactra antiquata]